MALAIGEEVVDGVTVLSLTGRLDNETASDLELMISDLVEADAKQFVIDFGELSYISNAGLGALLSAAKLLPRDGGMRLAALNRNVQAVFDAADATPLFAIFADRDAALDGKARAIEENRVSDVVARLLGASPAAGPGGKADPQLVARVAALLAD